MSNFGERQNVISTLNSRPAAALDAGGVFQGEGEDVSGYARVGVSIVSDNPTDGVLTIEVSRDGIKYSGPERTWADTRFAQPKMWEIVEQYFRIKYTNGTTPADNLLIQVQYSVNGGILLGHQLDELLTDETAAILTRTVLVSKDEAGVYRNITATQGGGLIIKEESSREIALALAGLGEILREMKHYLESISDP